MRAFTRFGFEVGGSGLAALRQIKRSEVAERKVCVGRANPAGSMAWMARRLNLVIMEKGYLTRGENPTTNQTPGA